MIDKRKRINYVMGCSLFAGIFAMECRSEWVNRDTASR